MLPQMPGVFGWALCLQECVSPHVSEDTAADASPGAALQG